VPGNAVHRALIRASEAANDTPSTFASGVSSSAIDSYIVSRPSQAALRNCFNKQAYIEAVVGLLTRRRPGLPSDQINNQIYQSDQSIQIQASIHLIYLIFLAQRAATLELPDHPFVPAPQREALSKK
jgi:hypothetical protein